MQATLLYASQCYLGEGPLWHEERKSCFWVDIDKGVLYEYNWLNRSIRTWQFNNKVTMVVQGKDDDLLITLDTSIARFNPVTEKLNWLFDVEKGTDNRCNDAACDSSGRLWVGTMHNKHLTGKGALYCIDEKNAISKKLVILLFQTALPGRWMIPNYILLTA